MAQTRRKRRSKHRGTAAGNIESRGRTGRKPAGSEKKAPATRAERARQRYDRPPSWRSAINRGVITALIFAASVLLIFKQKAGAAIALAAFMLVIYIPMGYYMDLYIYRRKLRQREQGGGGARGS
jgi:hypothetical protein